MYSYIHTHTQITRIQSPNPPLVLDFEVPPGCPRGRRGPERSQAVWFDPIRSEVRVFTSSLLEGAAGDELQAFLFRRQRYEYEYRGGRGSGRLSCGHEEKKSVCDLEKIQHSDPPTKKERKDRVIFANGVDLFLPVL